MMACLVLSLDGCDEQLGGACDRIADGTYLGASGDSLVISDGGVTGWSCVEHSSCPSVVTCTPPGETVYTTTLQNLGGGRIEATQSPPDIAVELDLQD